MRVTDIRTTHSLGRVRLDARILTESIPGEYHVFYDFPRQYWLDVNRSTGDPYLALTLLPAMVFGERLEIEAPISLRLSESLPHLQTVFQTMNPGWHKIEINAPIKKCRFLFFTGQRKRGLFFSLGVDSFYSLQRLIGADQRHTISHLIVVHGLDVYYRRRNHNLFATILNRARQVADLYDLKVLDVLTNQRDFSDHFVNWRTQYGCGTLSVGLALQRGFETIYLASGMTMFYDGFISYGSGPLITPHWSTERLKFIQHGAEAYRQDKVNSLADFSPAMDHLRVCWINPEDTYNCGKCEKCLRTMIALYISGVLGRCRSLPGEIRLEDIEKMEINNPTVVHIIQRLIDDLRVQPDRTDFVEELGDLLVQKIAIYDGKTR